MPDVRYGSQEEFASMFAPATPGLTVDPRIDGVLRRMRSVEEQTLLDKEAPSQEARRTPLWFHL